MYAHPSNPSKGIYDGYGILNSRLRAGVLFCFLSGFYNLRNIYPTSFAMLKVKPSLVFSELKLLPGRRSEGGLGFRVVGFRVWGGVPLQVITGICRVPD